MDHVFVDAPHLVVGQVQGLKGRVAEDAVVDGGQVVEVQPQGLEQVVLVEVPVANLSDFISGNKNKSTFMVNFNFVASKQNHEAQIEVSSCSTAVDHMPVELNS